MARSLCLCLFAGALLVGALTELSRADDFDVTLECSADLYAVGDSVFFTWANGTDSTLIATYHPPYRIYDGLTGQLVFEGILPWEYYLDPHEVAFLDWDQLDNNFEQFPPGVYRVHISFVFYEDLPDPPWYAVDDWFRILDTASVPEDGVSMSETTWGKIKQGHR